MKVDVIKKYFQSWLDNDVEIVKQTFSENALYSECYGPEYHGLSQIVTWFENWNNKGQVLEWTIKRIFEQNQTLIVEWYFRCNYDGKIDGFDVNFSRRQNTTIHMNHDLNSSLSNLL